MPNSAAADIDRRVKVIDGEGNDDRSIERVSDLRAMPFVVLLGVPGMGKSTVLAREAVNEGASMISVRELMTGTRRCQTLRYFSMHSTSTAPMAGPKTRFTRSPMQ
jgi:putative ribosome biogenesis GTPase RsgA